MIPEDHADINGQSSDTESFDSGYQSTAEVVLHEVPAISEEYVPLLDHSAPNPFLQNL